jgi:hypothetical protein
MMERAPLALVAGIDDGTAFDPLSHERNVANLRCVVQNRIDRQSTVTGLGCGGLQGHAEDQTAQSENFETSTHFLEPNLTEAVPYYPEEIGLPPGRGVE